MQKTADTKKSVSVGSVTSQENVSLGMRNNAGTDAYLSRRKPFLAHSFVEPRRWEK